jgi:hypothetical protein
MQKVNVTVETRIIKETVLARLLPTSTTMIRALIPRLRLLASKNIDRRYLAALSCPAIRVSRFYYTPGQTNRCGSIGFPKP